MTGNSSGIDWSIYLSAETLALTGSVPFAGPGLKSMFEMYLVDEESGSCELVKTLDVSFSGIMSSTQLFCGNIVVGSATQFKIYEFDTNGNQLLKISFDSDDVVNQPMFYRVFKYQM